MNKQEKIIWINVINTALIPFSTNDFNYDMYGVIHPEAKNITFQLLDAIISTDIGNFFFVNDAIIILFDFNVSHNQYSKSLNNYIVGGIISPMLIKNNYSEQMIKEGPIYQIKSFPNGLINIRIVNNLYVDLEDDNNTIPNSVILCLKFTYDI